MIQPGQFLTSPPDQFLMSFDTIERVACNSSFRYHLRQVFLCFATDALTLQHGCGTYGWSAT
jgi:hypothetical protein